MNHAVDLEDGVSGNHTKYVEYVLNTAIVSLLAYLPTCYEPPPPTPPDLP